MPAGSSSDRPAIRPGPMTAAKATSGAIPRLLVTGEMVVWVISCPDLALPRPATVVFPGKDVHHVVGKDAADRHSCVVKHQ